MAEPLQPAEFLTAEESAAVDRALLATRDKFLTRVALYSLRSLREISKSTGQAIETITPTQVEIWIEQDDSLRQEATNPSFRGFFVQLVLSSLKPLTQTAQMHEKAIADLSVDEVISWFEQDAKQRMTANLDALE